MLLILFGFILINLSGTKGMAGNSYGDRVCATLFSEVNFGGNKFVLGDGDQSVNMKRDFRSSIDGWGNTSSIRVEENCTLTACPGTYFYGMCTSYLPGDQTDIPQLPIISSASCTCSKVCKCEDIVILKNKDVCGRAYVNGTCNECDSQYLQLWYKFVSYTRNIPSSYVESVRTLAVRRGCLLFVFTQYDGKGDMSVIMGPIDQDFRGRFGSYKCECYDYTYKPPSRTISFPISLNLSSSSEQLLEMIFSNATLAAHPGLLAAKASLQSGRSHKNAYVLIIGITHPVRAGLPFGCESCINKICDCHVALDVPDLGISQAQIRVVWASFHTAYGSDAHWVASLDQYLSTHEELKDSIPNAVIVYDDDFYDWTIADKGSTFQRKLAAVNALRGRLLDANYSNLLFVIKDEYSSRNPNGRIRAFEAAINENWNFPRPTVVLPVHNLDMNQPKVNGNWKLTSGEYYFQNVYRALLLASEKSGDALGHAIFKAVFPVADKEWTFVRKLEVFLLPANHTNVTFYEQLGLELEPTRLQAFTTQIAMQRTHNISVKAEKIHRGEQIANFVRTMSSSGVINTCSYGRIRDICGQNISTQNENLQWNSVSSLTFASRKFMRNFGFVNGQGIKLFVCRGFVNGVVRVGSFTFEDGTCQIWFKKLISLTENAEVLMIPRKISESMKAEENGTEYRLQYKIVSSHQIPQNASAEHIVPVFAGNSHTKNANKYIAFATFAEGDETGMEAVDKIGTASLYPPKPKQALFSGMGRPLYSKEFKVLVLTKTRIHTPSNN